MQFKLKTMGFFIGWIAMTCSVFAIKVDKLQVYEKAKPGQVIEGVINVINDRDTPMNIFSGIQDFSYDPVQQSVFFQPFGTQKNSCSAWIQLSPKETQIPPQSTKAIQYIITVPQEGLETGEYYSLGFVESAVGAPDLSKDFALGSRARMGIIFKITLPDLAKPEGSITEFQVTPGKEDKPMEIKYAFTNSGNTIQKVNGSFTIIDKEGNLFGRGTLRGGIAMGGDSINIKTTWDGELEPGSYDLIAELKFDPDVVDIKEVTFTVE